MLSGTHQPWDKPYNYGVRNRGPSTPAGNRKKMFCQCQRCNQNLRCGPVAPTVSVTYRCRSSYPCSPLTIRAPRLTGRKRTGLEQHDDKSPIALYRALFAFPQAKTEARSGYPYHPAWGVAQPLLEADSHDKPIASPLTFGPTTD